MGGGGGQPQLFFFFFLRGSLIVTNCFPSLILKWEGSSRGQHQFQTVSPGLGELIPLTWLEEREINVLYTATLRSRHLQLHALQYLGSEWWKFDFLKIHFSSDFSLYYGLLYHKTCLRISIWPPKPIKTAKNVNFWKMENYSILLKLWHFLAQRWSKTMYNNVFE